MESRGRTKRLLDTLGYMSMVSSAVYLACSRLSRETLLRLTLDIIMDAVGQDNAFSALYLEKDGEFHLQHYRAPFAPPEVAPPELLSHLRTRNVEVLYDMPKFAVAYCHQGGSLVRIPLSIRDRLTGFIAVCTAQDVELDAVQRETLLALGTICAMGIEMISLYERLTKKIKEVQLMQEKLLENQRLSLMQRLVAGITHEIKNPLAAAYGIAQLLQEGEPVDTEVLNRLVRTLKRAKEQVFGLLDFAKPPKPRLIQANVAELLEQVVDMLHYELRKKRIELIQDYDRAVAALIDTSQVNQVLLNLIMNAIDAVHKGGTIFLRVGKAHNGMAQITVADNGEGIPAEQKKRLFEPFFTTKKGGSGLGLFMCYNIVKNNNGRIFVKSKTGRGTVFSLLFPSTEPTE